MKTKKDIKFYKKNLSKVFKTRKIEENTSQNFETFIIIEKKLQNKKSNIRNID